MKKTPWLLVLGLALACLALVFTHDPPMKRSSAQDSGAGYHPIGNAWNVAGTTSGSKIFASNLTPSRSASVLRISVALAGTQKFSIQETDGTNTFTFPFNSGTALTANCGYTFVWGVRNSASAVGGVSPGPTSFNFVLDGSTTVLALRVDELTSGVD